MLILRACLMTACESDTRWRGEKGAGLVEEADASQGRTTDDHGLDKEGCVDRYGSDCGSGLARVWVRAGFVVGDRAAVDPN